MQSLEQKINYYFDNDGILLNKQSNMKIGNVTEEEYKDISNYASNYILHKLIVNYELKPLYVPFNSNNYYNRDKTLEQCIILASKDIEYNPRCLILIRG